MSEILSPIILVGPTTVGKSDVAAALSNQLPNVHRVNADKYGLYADGNYFEVGFGLEPGELDTIQRPHLYGCLDPSDSLPSPEAYAEMAQSEVEAIHALGGVAVGEGCSYRYNRALLRRFGVEQGINLTWAYPEGLPTATALRAGRAFEWGLLEETERALDAGYEATVPMSSMLYRPAIRILRGQIDQSKAYELIQENWLDNALEHDVWYAATSGLVRLVHDRAHPEQTAAKIISRFTASHPR